MAEYLPRHADAALETAIATHPVVLLEGARGVGKTTSARRVAKSVLEFPRDLARVEVDPERALRDLPGPVLIDEWQLGGTDLLWAIKRIVDDRAGAGQFILVGSVEPASYGPTYPLIGRAVGVRMRPMTGAELAGAGAAPTAIEAVFAGRMPRPSAGTPATFSMPDLFTSGFPGTRGLPNAETFLESYATLLAQRGGDEGRDTSRLFRVLRVLATLEGQATPASTVWDAADITKVTWHAYSDLLERVHITADLPAFATNRLSRLTTYPKRFLADTALALALSAISVDDVVQDPGLAGRYLESHVMQLLRPQVDRVGGSLMHLRMASGEREIDAVIESRGQLIAIEVKASAMPKPADAKHLGWFRDQMGSTFTVGLVVHTGGDVFELDDRMWAVPVTWLSRTL